MAVIVHFKNATFRCFKQVYPILQSEGLLGYLQTPMQEASKYLIKSSILGLKVHKERADELGDKFQKIIDEIDREVKEVANNDKLNLNSPEQKVNFIFQDLGIPEDGVKRTPTGQLRPIKIR